MRNENLTPRPSAQLIVIGCKCVYFAVYTRFSQIATATFSCTVVGIKAIAFIEDYCSAPDDY